MKTYSLQELNEFLRRVIALNFHDAVWVTAEIGQISISRGHYYISLLQKEDNEIMAQMSGVIWALDFKRIQRALGVNTEGVIAEGVEIKFKGRIDFHEKFGLKIIIEDIDASFTIGKFEMQRRQLIADLQRKGLTERNKTRALPTILQRIAVISSETAAGWQDFKSHISHNEYAYGFEIQFFQSAMQGSLLEKTMLSQLDNIKTHAGSFDCVVIIRGGGSRLDLAAFDTPSVCEAVAKFPIPVLTGIGHDIDQTVMDMVAHTALKTPTAVADFILGHNLKFESSLLDIKNFLHHYIQERFHTEGGLLSKYENFINAHVLFSFKNQKNLLDNFQHIIAKNVQNIVKIEKFKIDNAAKIIDLIGIEATLKRGFSITRLKKQPVSSVKDVKIDDVIETQLADGVIESQVK